MMRLLGEGCRHLGTEVCSCAYFTGKTNLVKVNISEKNGLKLLDSADVADFKRTL